MIYFCYKKYFALTWLGVAGADQCVACRHERRSAPQRGEGRAAYARAATHPLWCRAGSFSTARTCRPADKATLEAGLCVSWRAGSRKTACPRAAG